MQTPAPSSTRHRGAAPVRPSRPREMQDPLNYYLYHPLAWQLARVLARTPATPNMVSVAGALLVVAAGFAYVGLEWPVNALVGLALHMSWHVVDGADGDLARITGTSSPRGEMVDGLCDYLSHVVLYLLLGVFLQQQIGWFAWVLVVAAGLSHIVQSNHVEVQRRFYLYWMYGVPWLHHARGEKEGLFGEDAGGSRMLRVIADLYLWLAAGMTPHARRIDAAVTAAADDPARLAMLRAEITRHKRPLLLLLKVLGPNPRALVLGASMLAGGPLWYMLYQAVVLNLLLALSVRAHNRAARAVVRQLELN